MTFHSSDSGSIGGVPSGFLYFGRAGGNKVTPISSVTDNQDLVHTL